MNTLPPKSISDNSRVYDKEFALFNSPYFDRRRTFYVCSFGGCGSRMLCVYLGFFGVVRHIHSRAPPAGDLRAPYNVDGAHEWFNPATPAPAGTVVIYLYRDPIRAIMSRFVVGDDPTRSNRPHLRNIQCQRDDISLAEVIHGGRDFYGLEQFHDNYTLAAAAPSRKYAIVCVKYETLWENIAEFNRAVGIPNRPNCYQPRKETAHGLAAADEATLRGIYGGLIKKMSDMPPILVIIPST